ncbi:hypothetical protein BCR35DRAFT_332688 [Leucosporidium creatinivorum]|uniref:CipC-like antibiotic response protein n=1 Tax=Leucosporidium creatinivorum TaxID=106004 RepID=A0A1Y2F0J1_9BASI|nr:hypothetical protein BCR35DRAFT_332688 [Leucosporidium creatinivorum]
MSNPTGFFSHDSDQAQAHAAVYGGEQHQSSWSHEAAKAYEKHVAQNGPPPSHQLAKELLAGFAAAEADKLFETKGLDEFDREKAKYEARKQAEQNVPQDGYNLGY